MLKRPRSATFARMALPALALALGACAYRHVDDGYGESVGPEVVLESAYPQRVYYYEPHDSINVYYYDSGRPDVVVDRRVYREHDGRTYYVEHDRGADRRFYYDDSAARSRRAYKGHGGDRGHR